ncbi:hypothetical protein CANINC_002352 [Pichia inconspicua]|uniref:Uncharacterized protein n=1 Tax=Pichia inconspicua TaxID=52247 RepID=A0A4T0X2N5_9ASCO|nr:hypothetical protein CANINC_002352 [[Candida] inconspicua]
MLLETASSIYSSSGVRTPESETFDSVYRPYVTPPTPFEKTTHNLDPGYNANTNPYAQSMWWTTRGNTGEEIKKYKAKPEDTQQKANRKENIKPREQSEKSKELYDTLWRLLQECDTSNDTSIGLSVHDVKEPNVEVGKVKEGHKRSLLPSLMAKVETLENSDYGDFFSYEDEVNQANVSNIDENVKLEIIQSYINESSLDENLLRPLKNPLPYKCIQIQSLLVKRLKCIAEISLTFDRYAEDESIVVNSKVKLHMFGNIKTLLIMHYNFLNSMIRKSYMDTEEMVYDNLQRLMHVYPSYLSSIGIRKHIVHLILNNEKFKAFVGDVTNEEFMNLILSPAIDFSNLLDFLDSYISKSSPRIEVVISKLKGLYANTNETSNSYNFNEELYLMVPAEWKKLHKIHWKEIHHLHPTKQIAAYLRWILKTNFLEYSKIVQLIQSQIENISRLGVSNKQLTVYMKRMEDFPGDIKERKYFNIDDQNKQLYSLIDSFFQFINDETFEECEALVKRATLITKRIFHNEETSYVTEKLFDVHDFIKLFRYRTYLIFVRFVLFFHQFVGLMDQKGVEDINNIINSFTKAREVSVTGGWEKFMAREKVAKPSGLFFQQLKQINKDIWIAELEEQSFENYGEVASLVFTGEGITDKSLKQTVSKLIEMFYDEKTWNYSKDQRFSIFGYYRCQKENDWKVLDEPALKKRKISELELEDFPNVKFNSFDYRFDFFGMTKVKLLGHYLINESLEAYFKEKHIKPIKLYGMFKGAKDHSLAENAGMHFSNVSNGSSRAEEMTHLIQLIHPMLFQAQQLLILREEYTNADTATSSMDIIDQDEILPLENAFFESEFGQGIEFDSMPDARFISSRTLGKVNF